MKPPADVSEYSKEFITEISGYSIECDEELVSFDVTALYTSLPIDRTLKVVAALLEDDDSPCIATPPNHSTGGRPARIMSTIHIFLFPRQVLQT